MTVLDLKVEISLVLTDSLKSEHSVTCLSQFAQHSARFEGSLNVDLNEITMNLVPFPKLHYLVASQSPLYTSADVHLPPRKLDQMFSDAFSRDHQLLRADPKHSLYLACALMVRGNVEISDVRRNIERILSLHLILLNRPSERIVVSVSDDDSQGIRRSGVVEWYLREIEADIDSEAELIERKTIVEKVIDRLVQHDHVLIELKQTGLKTSEGLVREDDPFLVVHPNYVIDS
ncbi:TUBE [Mytilus edulis]|uniref:TUBE n=1 Tax=Mytilus edulis TaxID=6550 RepID=A0A8S3V3T7_MYTED|nr:TUBE [Mytilus edulis]